ncbi:ESCRT-II complex subunit (macronuclear) [Tetrahymena thermophila SB210]|uniref:ESCRT-II complex subunit n=1 Tax=Tetrahymena thermophila (strain SB210) TaxID=312017 RepID=Q248A9_TETTS|nr:ESCRT-II complex subunit [Tetrahymena thermophila SB210]EAS04136.2 ESCRT-II complex subunit [Tetrahymena thermophila SB210]|eukprot:XP_001024381.2 ESCRT-II complex subunit [Tetrahymena thermophila SB210]
MAQRFQSVIQDFQEEKQDYYSKLLQHPAFYTIQDHAETRQKQLASWADITHAYFKQKNINNSSLTELSSESYPFFCLQNLGIPKRLNREEIKLILYTLAQQGSILWENENYDGFQVQKYSANEIADEIYKWAKKNYQIGEINTLEFIVRGNQTSTNEKFYDLPDNQILYALEVLQENKKCIIFGDSTSGYSAKFQ